MGGDHSQQVSFLLFFIIHELCGEVSWGQHQVHDILSRNQQATMPGVHVDIIKSPVLRVYLLKLVVILLNYQCQSTAGKM